jgi:hypothetical protein
VVATGLIHAAFLLVYLLIYRGEISSFVCADREKIGRWPFEAVCVGFGSQGFDGQYYYVLARDPWQRHEEFIDLPAYRHSRIVYPALAWLLSRGDAELLLWILPAINWAAIVGLGWLGAILAQHYGRSPWWAVALPLVVNAGAPALRDLTDPVSILAAAGLVTSWLLGWRPWLLAGWALAAVLSREQNVVIVFIVLLEALSRRRGRAVSALAVALLIWVGWICLLRSSYGVWPFVSENINMPCEGIYYRLTHMLGGRGTMSSPVHVLGMFLLLLQLAFTLYLVAIRAERLVLLLCLTGAGLALMAGVSIFLNLESYTRVFWWMPFGIWLWSIKTGRVAPILCLSCAAALPCLALVQAWHTVQMADVRFLR